MGSHDRGFMTEGRLNLAKARADALAQQRPWLTGVACAEQAVRHVFGRWLFDETGSISPQCLPLYFQLVSKVENQLGVHRTCRRWAVPPETPLTQGMARPLPERAPTVAGATMACAA